MIEIINITKEFKTTTALKEVNMHIKAGDIYGFVGENGAGKSTLFKIIANVIKPTSGEVIYNFENTLGILQAIVEEPSLHMDLTAINNLIFQNDLFNLRKTKEELIDVLKLVGLEDVIFSKKKVKHYSLGMKQRLSIAMSLVSSPQIILLDEPMNGLDPVGIKEVRELILKLNQEQNITFLISSHILSELDKVATRYGFISKGVLVKEITHKELHENTRNYIKVVFENEINENDFKIINKYTYQQINVKTIHINDKVEVNEIIRYLVKNDVLFKTVEQVNIDIEEFYLEVTRGVNHD